MGFPAQVDNGPNSQDVWVDSTNGSDSNTGYIGSPLKTIGEVYRRFPVYQFSAGFQGGSFVTPTTITVNLMSNGALRADYPVLTILCGAGADAAVNQYRYRGPQMVLATDLATGPNRVVGGLTITAVARRTRIDVAPNPAWTANNLRGKFVRFTRPASGLMVIWECPIAENDNDSIFVDTLGYAGVIQAGDILEVVTPGARFVSASSLQQILMTGIGQAGYLPAPIFWGGVDPSNTFERIHIANFPLAAGVHGLTFDRCTLDNTPFIKGGHVGFVNTLFTLGVKLSCHSLEFPVNLRPDSATNPISQVQSSAVEVMSQDIFLIGNPDGAGQYLAKRNIGVYTQSNAQRGAIHVVGPGSLFWADDGSLSYIQVALLGSGNAGPFIWCVHGAQARINTTAGASPFTVGTGTGNPLRVGVGAGNPAIIYGTGAGAFEEAVGFNGNFSRAGADTATVPISDFSRIFLNP